MARKKWSWDDAEKIEQQSSFVDSGPKRFRCEGGFDRIRIASQPEEFETQDLIIPDGKGGTKVRPVPASDDPEYVLNKSPKAPQRKRKYSCAIVHVAHKDKERDPWTPINESKWWAFSKFIVGQLRALVKSLPEGKGLLNVDIEVSLQNDPSAVDFQKLVLAALVREQPMCSKKVLEATIANVDEIMAKWTTPLPAEKVRAMVEGKESREATTFEFEEDSPAPWAGGKAGDGDVVDDDRPSDGGKAEGEGDVDLDAFIDEAAQKGKPAQAGAKKPAPTQEGDVV